MPLQIVLDLGYDAIKSGGPHEVSRILQDVAMRLSDPLRPTDGDIPLCDFNGNTCGFARIVTRGDNREVVEDHCVQVDVGGSSGWDWQPVEPCDLPAGILSELAGWIIDETPEPGEMRAAADSRFYRLPPAGAPA